MSDSSQHILSLILHTSQWDLFSLFHWSIRADSSSAVTKISLVMWYCQNVQISDQFVLNLLLIALDHETCLLLTRLLAYHGRVESHLRNSFGFSLCVCTNQLPNLIIMGIFDREHILRSTYEFFLFLHIYHWMIELNDSSFWFIHSFDFWNNKNISINFMFVLRVFLSLLSELFNPNEPFWILAHNCGAKWK